MTNSGRQQESNSRMSEREEAIEELYKQSSNKTNKPLSNRMKHRKRESDVKVGKKERKGRKANWKKV